MTKAPWPNAEPRRRCMKPELWPAADQAAWKAARAPGDFLEPGGPASRWRPATVKNAEQTWGRLLTCLEMDGRLDPEARPASRVTPENVLGYIEILRGLNAPVTMHTRVSGLLDMIIVLEPGGDFAWLERIRSNLEVLAIPSRNKASLVVPTDELVDLGFKVMREARRARSPVEAATRRQYGLMIALLALVPLRRRNFTTIRIGEHLRKVGEGYKLVFPGTEMKNHQAFEAPVPGVLTAALEHHLTVDRPILAARSHTARARRRPAGDALWVSRFGSALSANCIYDEFRRLTRAHFGRPMPLHLARTCAATTIANDDPAHVGSIAPVLGHGSDEGARYYNVAGGIEAASKHQEMMRSLRGGGGEPRAPPSSRWNPPPMSLPPSPKPRRGRPRRPW